MNAKLIAAIVIIQVIGYQCSVIINQQNGPCTILTPQNCNPPVPAPCTCLNGGTCVGGVCHCPPAFTGARCETQYFSCTTNGRFPDQYGCAQGRYFECGYVRDNARVDPTGVLYSRQCPNGLRFNPSCDNCDYAAFVHC